MTAAASVATSVAASAERAKNVNRHTQTHTESQTEGERVNGQKDTAECRMDKRVGLCSYEAWGRETRARGVPMTAPLAPKCGQCLPKCGLAARSHTPTEDIALASLYGRLSCGPRRRVDGAVEQSESGVQ